MRNHEPEVAFLQITAPDQVSPGLRAAVIDCWVTVSNSGGAVGFPFPPVGLTDVAPAVDQLLDELSPQCSRLILAMAGSQLAGWVNLDRSPDPLVLHWATVRHLQTRPAFRGRGIGAALMQRLRVIARDELALTQLHLSARGGAGLEGFYTRLGWREVGRWPGALRFGEHDHRDEVLMLLDPL